MTPDDEEILKLHAIKAVLRFDQKTLAGVAAINPDFDELDEAKGVAVISGTINRVMEEFLRARGPEAELARLTFQIRVTVEGLESPEPLGHLSHRKRPLQGNKPRAIKNSLRPKLEAAFARWLSETGLPKPIYYDDMIDEIAKKMGKMLSDVRLVGSNPPSFQVETHPKPSARRTK